MSFWDILLSRPWQAGTANSTRGDFVFLSGPLLILSGLMEFILGNTFSFVVFMSYGKCSAPTVAVCAQGGASD